MPTRIALLRGINLGSRRRLSMPELRELLTGLGHANVRTLLQSGNVVLSSDAEPGELAAELSQQIATGFGIDTPVVVRTRDELADVVARDPLRDVVTDFKRYQVSFLSGEPDPEIARALAGADLAPEQVVLSGREIYAWHPAGLQRSPLAGLLTDPKLGVTATARNWNTVTALLALADESR